MIPVYKLQRLPPGQRRRKLIMMLSQIEQSMLHPGENTESNSLSADVIVSIITLVLEDESLSDKARSELDLLLHGRDETFSDARRIVNTARHALLSVTGALPAEWDLVVPWAQLSDSGKRPFFPGVSVYAEDIRSPFNLGSIFRTAEAFGAEKVLVSPLCVSPEHQRAQRSAMGCTEYLPWEVMGLANLPADVPVFALETGGTPIDEFAFPEHGIVIVGSEELGISPEALARARYGRVSIPMYGIKASLNVGVAFGILMQYWSAYLVDS